MLLFLLCFSEVWHKVINNTIPQGVRVRWNLTNHQMEYTHTLINNTNVDAPTLNAASRPKTEERTDIIINKKLNKKTEAYSPDDFLEHYFLVNDQMFLRATKAELEANMNNLEFVESLAYNGSDISAGIVMANSQLIELVIDHIKEMPVQQAFRAIVQNNHFAQSKIHERYPYLLSYFADELELDKAGVKMISAYIRGNQHIAQVFIDRIGIKWVFDKIQDHPHLKTQLNCLGFDVGSSVSDQVIQSLFTC